MKKFIVILLSCIFLCLCLMACDTQEETVSDENKDVWKEAVESFYSFFSYIR